MLSTPNKTTWSDATFFALCEATVGLAKISELGDVYRLVGKYRALTEDDFKIVDGQDAYKHKVRAEIMRFKNKGLVRSPARGLYTVDKSRVLENAEERLKTLCLSLNLPAERLREIERTSTVQERVKLLMQECKQQLATEATDA